jgi:A/G-specific adenine glycosylase
VPTCDVCPLTACAWRRAGLPDPDPATGSAGVSTRQAPFAGSGREARGRVLRALGAGPQPAVRFDERIVRSLVADGLVVIEAGMVRLPD